MEEAEVPDDVGDGSAAGYAPDVAQYFTPALAGALASCVYDDPSDDPDTGYENTTSTVELPAPNVRDANELAQSGKLAGALNVSRGMVEFRADRELPYYNTEFRKDRPVILYCASGGRSALSAKALQDIGYDRVYNLGGFKDAAEAGFATEPAT